MALVVLGLLAGGVVTVGGPIVVPTVVPTAEGQIGETPGVDDRILGPLRFESIRGQDGELVFGGIFVAGGASPPPPEVQFFTDRIHASASPAQVGGTPDLFSNIDKVTPDSSRARNAADDGDFVAFSFAVDGSMPQTLTVRIATFDETGSSLIQVPIIEDLAAFSFPDPFFAKTAVAIDNQGRATITFTEFVSGSPQVRATRVNGVNGTSIDSDFLITAEPHGAPDVALLDPAGNRLIVATNELTSSPAIRGHIVEFSGAAPVVGPEFAIDDTEGGFGAINPAVAVDPATGKFTVAWEFLADVPGDPVNIRARRFDALGNPIGGDFRVNTTTANSQGQPSVAYGPDGYSAIVWAGDPIVPMPDDLDVFLQVYDPSGNPIGGEIQANTFTDDIQDRPAVRFLPDRDAAGRTQVAVVWRDVATPDGAQPRGTGVTYKCFSVDGFEEQLPIFEDGFESGDTSSWSASQP